MEKMKNTANFFYTGSKVAYGIFNAGTWICGVVAVLIWFLPETAFWNGTESLSFGFVSVTRVPDGMLAPIWVRVELFEQLLLCFIVLFFACKALRILQNILQPMTLGQPFTEDVSVNMRKLAWLCLIGGAVSECARLAGIALTIGQTDLMALFNASVVQSAEVSYELNMWFLPVFILLMLMSHVFAYGQQLQQLSDETL